MVYIVVGYVVIKNFTERIFHCTLVRSEVSDCRNQGLNLL
jgi:hypothetical protein